jgi:hypothetical protein
MRWLERLDLAEPCGERRQRPLAEHPDLLVQPLAQPGDLVLGQPGDAQLLHQPIHPPGADAADPGLLDDRDQGLLGPPARFQEAREVGALAQPGDRQLQSPTRVSKCEADTRCGGSVAGGALAELGADLRGDLGLHQLRGHPGRAVAQHIGVLVSEQLVRSWAAVILGLSAIVVILSSFCGNRPTILRRRGGRTHIRPARLLHHYPRRDRRRSRDVLFNRCALCRLSARRAHVASKGLLRGAMRGRDLLLPSATSQQLCARSQLVLKRQLTSVSAGQHLCGAPRRNRTGDPILTIRVVPLPIEEPAQVSVT